MIPRLPNRKDIAEKKAWDKHQAKLKHHEDKIAEYNKELYLIMPAVDEEDSERVAALLGMIKYHIDSRAFENG